MLQVSETAITALQAARDAQELPDSFGVRVFGEPTDSGQMAVSLTFAEVPLENDQVTEQDGTQLFIAPEVAEPLSASVIDLEDTAQGPELVIKPQAEGG
jgi:Fe-S cluster assembly iron-binding protein IscA